MDEIAARRAACTDMFLGNGFGKPDELLASIGSHVEPDLYGEGGVVAELEREVADLLGKPAAVYLPSGTMAQAATLRVHADARGSRTVLWHPYCHLAQHENEAFARLHGLIGRPVGWLPRLITLDDLHTVVEPVAALLLELPQRDLGGQLPSFDDLTAQVEWARDRGAAVHFLFSTTAARFAANAKRIAEQDKFWIWPKPFATDDPDVVRAELTVGSATLRHNPTFIATTLASLL